MWLRSLGSATRHSLVSSAAWSAQGFTSGIFWPTLFQCGVKTFLVEGSHRPSDQAEHLSQMLMKDSASDRTMIVFIVKRLPLHLTRKTDGRKKMEEREIFL
jgi:hypothetical protein